MALPTAYLVSYKNVDSVLNAIQQAKAPPKFTLRFLEDLGFKSSGDRLFINVFKVLGLLSPDGAPTPRYFEFLDQSQSGRVLAEALEDAYSDLYQLRRDAQKMERAELRGRFKTLTQGRVSDNVVDKMVWTFQAFAKLADFDAPRPSETAEASAGAVNSGDASEQRSPEDNDAEGEAAGGHLSGGLRPGAADALRLGGLVYNIELHLPESRDPAVYDALFKSLKTHLLP